MIDSTAPALQRKMRGEMSHLEPRRRGRPRRTWGGRRQPDLAGGGRALDEGGGDPLIHLRGWLGAWAAGVGRGTEAAAGAGRRAGGSCEREEEAGGGGRRGTAG
jgi:hypothetical protein